MWKTRRNLLAAIVAVLVLSSACQPKEKQHETAELTEFATRYAAAWSSQDPVAFAAFYAENGSFRINDGEPAIGRDAIEETARSFMIAFPDMVVRLVELRQSNDTVEFHWNWTGTNTGPGGTGNAVDLVGFEQWRLTEDGVILESRGNLDDAEYQRQLNADAADQCADFGEYSYICGPIGAEDLVLVPDTKWVIASGFGGGASLYLLDSEQKTWSSLYPENEPRARQNMKSYGSCSGPPNADSFVAHGLNIRAGADGHSTLYVVGHGEREAIEVFDVETGGDEPVLTWSGCVMMPDGMEANSVTSLADGSLLATIPLHTGIQINEAFAGKPTGAVYAWAPGDASFRKIDGTEMPYANGIEVSDDGKEFYIASSGLVKILAFSNTRPGRLLRTSKVLSFIPDNLHMGKDGNLVTAGMALVDPECGDVAMSLAFDLGEIASCPRPFTVLAVDPQSMQESVLASSPAQPNFSNVTMALEVGTELWIGTFAGDRIAYRSLDQKSD